jgi:hypothetical protein
LWREFWSIRLLLSVFALNLLSCQLAPTAPQVASGQQTQSADESLRPVALHRRWGSGLLILDAGLVGDRGQRQRASLIIDSAAEISGLLEAEASVLPEGNERVSVAALHGGGLNGRTVMAGVFAWPPRDEPRVLSALPKNPFVVFPSRARLPGGANGLIGADFLMREKIAIDVGNACLVPTPLATPYVDGDDEWLSLPMLAGAGDNHLLRFLLTTVGDQVVVWLVDSGAEKTLLTELAAARLNIGVFRSRRNTELVDAGGGRVSLGQAVMKATNWGAHRMREFSVGVAPMKNLQRLGVSGGHRVDGILGLDILAKHYAIIDMSGQRLWLRLP